MMMCHPLAFLYLIQEKATQDAPSVDSIKARSQREPTIDIIISTRCH